MVEILYFNENTQKIFNYVKNGGLFISTCPLGLFDEYANKDFQTLNKIGITNTTRIKSPAFIKFNSGLKISVLSENTKIWNCELNNDSDIEILAKFADGSPAIIKSKIGKGELILTAYPLSFTSEKDIAEQLKILIGNKVQKIAQTQTPVNLFVLKKDDKIIIYATNKEVYPVQRVINLSEEFMVEDLRAEVRFCSDKIPLSLGPGETRVFTLSNNNNIKEKFK